MLDIPLEFRGPDLGLGRYYVILLETDEEVATMERELDAERDGPVQPSHFDRRSSNLASASILLARYDPPYAGWPWLSVCRWPPTLACAVIATGVDMARDCYTMEAFETAEALDAHNVALLEALRERVPVDIRLIAADRLHSEGRS